MRRLFLPLVLLCATACGNANNDSGGGAPEEVDAASGMAPFAIATAHPLATEAGKAILEQGGTAVDAAIAAQAVLSLVEPQSSGLGGGAFMLHYDPATDILETYDGREIAPASASPTMFLKEDGSPVPFYDAVTGGRSVGVPGVVAMLAMAHEEHGKLPLADLLTPAENHATDGFAITPRLHQLVTRMSSRGKLAESPEAAAYFLDSDGAPHPVGHILKNPAYARTLRLMAENGPQTFYIGQVAEEIAVKVNSVAGPGVLGRDDFLAYRPVKRDAVCVIYRTKKVCSMAPPSSGGVTVLQILQLLEHTSFADQPAGSPTAWHLLLEASRLAYADRNLYLADPDYMATEDFSAEDIIQGLLDADYNRDRAKLIREDLSSIKVAPGDPTTYKLDPEARPPSGERAPDASPELPSTSHFSIMDREGRVVSMTTSVEFVFGSHLMAGGMFLNNQLTDFSFVPEADGRPVANAAAPGKRPRSSMSPVIVFNEDGSVFAALGSPGGPAIIGYVAKTLVAMIDWELPLQEAIDQPNIVVPRGGVLVEEDRLDAERLEALTAFGHEASERALSSGIYGFAVTESGIEGGADKRREGTFFIAGQ